MPDQKVSVQEISQHNKQNDCWVVIDKKVWDITSFAPEHPGGPGIIYKYAGRDASEAYGAIHAPSIISEGLPANAFKGVVDESTITREWGEPLPNETPKAAPRSSKEKPPLNSIINTHDFEIVARNTATAKTWAFYDSAANDLVTKSLNAKLWTKILLRPRVMRRVDKITTHTKILNETYSFPLVISPAAMVKLIHPDGELCVSRAATTRNVLQIISNHASFQATDIAGQPSTRSHPHWFQLYVYRDRTHTLKMFNEIHALPNITAVMVTTDNAIAGKREADERVTADNEIAANPNQNAPIKSDKQGAGFGRMTGRNIDSNLNWDDIAYFRAHTHLPLLLKGIMSADDVKLALDHGCDGVMLSNHGGRNLDTSPPAVLTLLEIHARYPHIIRDHHPRSKLVEAGLKKAFSIVVDGGVRRGSDILKSICLGAVGCGIGRPTLFAAGYGQEGVEHLIDMLKEEFEVAMKNSGIASIEECGPEYVNTGAIDHLVNRGATHPYAVSFNDVQSKAKL